MKRRRQTTLGLMGWLLGGLGIHAAEPMAFYVNYSAKVPTAPLVAHALSIVHPDATVDLAAAHRAGATVLAYLSIGEVAGDAPYRTEVVRRRLPFAGHNPVWNSDLIDLTDPRWGEYLVDELAATAARRGFDGFFLDTLDSVDLVAPGDAPRTAALRQGLVAVVQRLHAAFPQKRIIVNRGFFAFAALREVIDGVLAESLFATHDSAGGVYGAVAPATTAALLVELRKIAAAGRPVYVIDYADPASPPAHPREVARQIRALGFHAFVSTPALDGTMLAPLRLVPRRICSFYGNLSTEQSDQVKWPAESFTATKLQLPLEWLGYEVDYYKVASRADLPRLGAECHAIVLPRLWQIPPAVEAPLVDWLVEQRAAGRRIVVLGSLPFRDREQRARFLEALDLGGSGAPAIRPAALEVISKETGTYDFEVELPLNPVSYVELRAPADARRILALRARPTAGPAVDFDPVFTCSWGGIALDPFLLFRRADFREFWRVDPFVFLQRALGASPAPAPDTTTRDGRRVFLSHIDGDGFSNFSRVEPGQRSAEIIRDRILKKFPLPVTVSIIEAELRALIRTQRAADAPVLEAIARDIFALPQVELASHTFSHPFFWIEGDRTEGFYDAAKLDLKQVYDHLDLTREIVDSVRYINELLAPPGRTVRVFQWSGNCRPPPAALALTRELGLENINGGDTLITARNRTLTAVAPRSMPWDGELQILAPNQNENVYTNNWRGPLFGTFSQVLETFALTESPRRLKPVNLYYHFYSGDYPASLHALETIYQWVMAQPLHPVTVSQYARTVRDARDTTIFSVGDEHWVIVNQGEARTFRLPAQLADRIDLARSPGVTGWKIESDQGYIHTDGAPVVTVSLAPRPVPHQPRLETSSGEISFTAHGPAGWRLAVSDPRPVELVFAGCTPGATVRVVTAGAAAVQPADATGRLRLTAPPQSRLELEFAAP